MEKIKLESVTLVLPFGENGRGVEVEVNDIFIASKTLSEQEIRKLSVDEIVLKRLYQIAETAETLPGLRCALGNGGDVFLRHDLCWLKSLVAVKPTFIVPMEKIDTSQPGPIFLLARS